MNGFIQVYAYNHDNGQKVTGFSEWSDRFLSQLTAGSAVFEERGEWDTARKEQQVVSKVIGYVRVGDFGNTFERTARFN